MTNCTSTCDPLCIVCGRSSHTIDSNTRLNYRLYRSDTDRKDKVHLQFRHHYHLKFNLYTLQELPSVQVATVRNCKLLRLKMMSKKVVKTPLLLMILWKEEEKHILI